MDTVDFRDKWVLRRTQRAGLCYLQCKYSNNRIVFIVSDPDFPNKLLMAARTARVVTLIIVYLILARRHINLKLLKRHSAMLTV